MKIIDTFFAALAFMLGALSWADLADITRFLSSLLGLICGAIYLSTNRKDLSRRARSLLKILLGR